MVYFVSFNHVLQHTVTFLPEHENSHVRYTNRKQVFCDFLGNWFINQGQTCISGKIRPVQTCMETEGKSNGVCYDV